MHRQSLDRGVGSGIEVGVQRAIGVEPPDTRTHSTAQGIELSNDHNLVVRLNRDPENITTRANREADARMIARFEAGDHAGVLGAAPTFRRDNHPEGWFGHALILLGALGGAACTAPGVAYSDYESAAGTGNIHLWFERPAGGWTASR